MATIKIEMKCLHCNEDSLENFDIKFMDELGFPDADCWSMTSGTQCNTCFERVSWRRIISPEEAVGIDSQHNVTHNVICVERAECDDEMCIHKVLHEPCQTCCEMLCYIKRVRVRCDKAE